ncbi:MAG TPA: hypothetical protein DCE42_11560, partial [Myxococcales bacterium]|nr:hypothetical protein [Myxococcales bacterium]
MQVAQKHQQSPRYIVMPPTARRKKRPSGLAPCIHRSACPRKASAPSVSWILSHSQMMTQNSKVPAASPSLK